MSKTKYYKAVIYLRLSKEDGDKEESYSISNQRDLAMDFLSRHPEIKLVCEMEQHWDEMHEIVKKYS